MKRTRCIALSIAACFHAGAGVALHTISFAVTSAEPASVLPLVACIESPHESTLPTEAPLPTAPQTSSFTPRQPALHLPTFSVPSTHTVREAVASAIATSTRRSITLGESVAESLGASADALAAISASMRSSITAARDRTAARRAMPILLPGNANSEGSGVAAGPAAPQIAASTTPEISPASGPDFSAARGPSPAPGNPAPKYPSQAARDRTQGSVNLAVHVSAEGHAISARVINSSGSALLDDAALAAVLTWRFNPALDEHGRAVECEATTSIDFRLRSASK